MGQKIAGLFACLVMAAILLESVGSCLRWHATRFMAGPLTLFLLHTNFLYVKMDKGANLLCTLVPKDLCEDLEEGILLHEAQQHWCAPMVTAIFAQPCEAFNWAYVMGMVCLCALVINIILLLASMYLLYVYIESPKHKAQYRLTAMILTQISTVMIAGAFLMHNMQAVRLLDEMGLASYLFIGASSGSGASYGCFVGWSGVLCQMVASLLFLCVAVGDEPTEDELAYEKAMKEEQRMQQAFDNSTYGSQGNADAPLGYGTQGYESHGYGNQAPASQGYAHQGYAIPGYADQGFAAPQPQFGQAAW